MRDSVQSSESRLTANTKNPSVFSSLPSTARSRSSAPNREMTVIRHRYQQRLLYVRDSRRRDFVQQRRRQLQRLGNAQRGFEGQRRLGCGAPGEIQWRLGPWPAVRSSR